MLSWEDAGAVLVTPVRHTGTPAICALYDMPSFPFLSDALEEDVPEGNSEDCSEAQSEELSQDNSSEAASREDRRKRSGENAQGHLEQSSQFSFDDDGGDDDADGLGRSRASAPQAETTESTDADPEVTTRQTVESQPRPFFIYQRRKFILRSGGGDADEGGGDIEQSFGLVELPVGWQLGR